MTTTLFAQPYDISAVGFYFDTAAQYEAKAARAVNDYGHCQTNANQVEIAIHGSP